MPSANFVLVISTEAKKRGRYSILIKNQLNVFLISIFGGINTCRYTKLKKSKIPHDDLLSFKRNTTLP